MTPEALYNLAADQQERLGHPWFLGPYNLNLLGYRAPASANLFNDVFAFVYEDALGKKCVERWAGTTDPGSKPMAKPTNPKGVFTMMPQRVAGMWVRGIHHGRSSQYPALVQRDKAVVFGWRGPTDRVTVHRDARGINFHHAHSAKFVDWYSEGCQVSQTQQHLSRALELFDMQGDYFPLAFSISYTLNAVADHPVLAPMLELPR